jgi:hypothetical protein
MAQITTVGTIDVGIFINPNTFTRQIAKSYEILGNRINLLSIIFTSGQRAPVRPSDVRWSWNTPSAFAVNGGINDSSIGLDGTTIYTYAGPDYLLKNPLFLKINPDLVTQKRPATIYESFLNMIDYLDLQLATRYSAVVAAAAASTGDITFNGVKIIGAGTAGENDYGTIELVPDSNRYVNEQYLVIDPTTPNHIHIRPGGIADESIAKLILGAELTNVSVSDDEGQHVKIHSRNEDNDGSHVWAFSEDGYMSVPANKDLLDAVDGSSLTGGGNRVVTITSQAEATYVMNGTANIVLAEYDDGDPFEITLPDSSEPYVKVGYEITIADKNGEAATSSNISIYPNESDSILGAPGGIIIDTDYGLVNLKYVGGNHWLLMYGR